MAAEVTNTNPRCLRFDATGTRTELRVALEAAGWTPAERENLEWVNDLLDAAPGAGCGPKYRLQLWVSFTPDAGIPYCSLTFAPWR